MLAPEIKLAAVLPDAHCRRFLTRALRWRMGGPPPRGLPAASELVELYLLRSLFHTSLNFSLNIFPLLRHEPHMP